ncbi:DotU family type IV/VI secretion system protein [Paraburkholderia mimosarum]|uniref:DotU family type IV/VI secretion system protein n=1 Tax=Paraburkholderia mimosarum TaxID=312026 RepID=UPI00040927EA|nr:DotU family type IV/VI secretion system protein [Paraburkholderia mimosarum]
MTLIDCLMPLFAQVRAFAQAPSSDAQTLTAQLDNVFAVARHRAQDAGHAQADVDAALFAFAAWADEVLLTTRWEGAAQWQRHLLQRRYFNLSNAGVAFYERLAQLPPAERAVREVFYLCLALGFGGRYAYDRNQKALTDIKRANLAMLLPDTELSASAQALLFPDGYGVASGAQYPARPTLRARLATRWSHGVLAAILLPLFLLLLLFGTYYYVVGQSVHTLLAQTHL